MVGSLFNFLGTDVPDRKAVVTSLMLIIDVSGSDLQLVSSVLREWTELVCSSVT